MLFVDFQLSEAAQEQSVAQGYFPALAGVTQPDGYPDPETLTIMQSDAQTMLTDDTAMKQQFADLFGG